MYYVRRFPQNCPNILFAVKKQARASPTVHFSFISDSHDPLSLDYQRCIRDVQAVIFCAECLLQHKHHFPQYHACTMYIVTIHCRVEGCIGKNSLPQLLFIDSYELCAKFWSNVGKVLTVLWNLNVTLVHQNPRFYLGLPDPP